MNRVNTDTRPERFAVLGLPVDGVDMEGALCDVERLVRTAECPGYLIAVNPEKVYAIRRNSFLREFCRRAAVAIPDGIGIVLASRWLHGRRVERLPGADLMQAVCSVAPKRGYRIFVYGASEDVNAARYRFDVSSATALRSTFNIQR